MPKVKGLCLTRKLGEDIVIGADTVIRVVEIRGDRVCLLIDAPRGVPVHRREVAEKVDAREAAEAGKAVTT